jgi:hypothetical protein
MFLNVVTLSLPEASCHPDYGKQIMHALNAQLACNLVRFAAVSPREQIVHALSGKFGTEFSRGFEEKN